VRPDAEEEYANINLDLEELEDWQGRAQRSAG
jgi:hypothetical protein